MDIVDIYFFVLYNDRVLDDQIKCYFKYFFARGYLCMILKKTLATILGVTMVSAEMGGANVVFGQNDITTSSEDESSTNIKSTSDGNSEFDFSDSNSRNLDLFYGNNLNVALKSGIDFLLNSEESPYINSKSFITDPIAQNALIVGCLKNIASYIENSNAAQKDKHLEILKRLSTLENMMNYDENIKSSNVGYKFISAMRSAYQTKISRESASDILEQYRQTIEAKLGKESQSTSVNGSTGISEGPKIGISMGAQTDCSSSEKTFYKIDNSGNIGISIGVGLKDYLEANLDFALGLTNSLIFYSLEQFLDAGVKKGNFSYIKITDDEIKEIISSREKMRDSERETLSKIQTSLEWFLKAANIVPQNTMFKWPEITVVSSNEKEKTVSLKADANAAASCLASMGINASITNSITKTDILNPYLDLIDTNCDLNDYFDNPDDLANFLGQAEARKYIEIKEGTASYLGCDKMNREKETTETEVLSILISNLIGDLRQYNFILSILADNNSTKTEKEKAHSKKKQIEKNWLGSGLAKQIHHHRSSIFKVALCSAAYLRGFASDLVSSEIDDLFDALYSEIEHLSLMQHFSKKLFGNDVTFETFRNSNTVSVGGSTFFSVPILGDSKLNITYSKTKSPLYTDNSEDVDVTVQLPVFGGKIQGIGALQKTLRKLAKTSPDESQSIFKLFADSLTLVDEELANVSLNFSLGQVFPLPTKIVAQNHVNLKFLLAKVAKTSDADKITPLPNYEPIKKYDDETVLKLTKCTENNLKKLEINASGGQFGVSTKKGKSTSKIGSDSLDYIINKFNACRLGCDNISRNSLWIKFKEKQTESLKNLFINITGETKNVRYELQKIYSMITENISEETFADSSQQKTLKTYTENIFENFLEACKDLADYDTTTNGDTQTSEEFNCKIQKAKDLMDTILNLNFEYVWLPALKHSMSVRN